MVKPASDTAYRARRGLHVRWMGLSHAAMGVPSGDDGTRTHDPLLADLTEADADGRHGAYNLISGAYGTG